MADFIERLQAAVGDTYRLEDELGGGGMSRVFVAEETRLGRQVVIKVLPPPAPATYRWACPGPPPIDVNDASPVDSLTAFATPKSVTKAWPSANMMLSGLMSRCTIPCLCAYPSARAVWARNDLISLGSRGPRLSSISESDFPRKNFMTK